MSRFILRYNGKGPKPSDDVERLLAETKARVVDDSARMILVEGPEHGLRAAVDKLENWSLSAENQGYPLPEPHPGIGKVEKPPKL